MRVGDNFLKCVCFIGYQGNGHASVRGTAFIASTANGRVVVTARHVINGIRHHAPGLPVALWVNGGQGIVRVDSDSEKWLSHPEDTGVDVAVLATLIDMNGFDHLAIQPAIFATDESVARQKIGIGDVLYFPGLFGPHKGRERLRPIIRQGTISAMPDEQVDTAIGYADAYLAEVRSIGGLSGSPVFVWLIDPWRIIPGTDEQPEDFESDMFVGLVQGHFDTRTSPEIDVSERVNMGISIVTPAQRIHEVIGQESVQSALERQRRGGEGILGWIPIASTDF